MSDYVYQPYPAWRYHPDQPAKIVQNAAEDEALEKGWVDSPHKVKVLEKAQEPHVAPREGPDEGDESDEGDSKPSRTKRK